jgi:hypothetical protein
VESDTSVNVFNDWRHSIKYLYLVARFRRNTCVPLLYRISAQPADMSGGAPVPVVVAEKILCIADLKEAGSKKLPQSARGESKPLPDRPERG